MFFYNFYSYLHSGRIRLPISPFLRPPSNEKVHQLLLLLGIDSSFSPTYEKNPHSRSVLFPSPLPRSLRLHNVGS